MRVDGKEIAENIYKELENRVTLLRQGYGGQRKKIIPQLAVILVGENPASVAYVTLKQKRGEAIGARINLIKYPTDITQAELESKVKELNIDPEVHGILIQRPLPEQIDVERLELLTDPEKDVDGFHPDSPYTLPLPLSVVKIIEEVHQMKKINGNFNGWFKSQNIVVIGKGPTGGGPIIKLLNKLGTNPYLIDSKTKNPEKLMKDADIIIASVGRENVVTPENLKPGVILVGVGILRGADGKLKGDYDVEKIKDIAAYYTPTPGGVGPVNVAMLMENLVTAAERQSS